MSGRLVSALLLTLVWLAAPGAAASAEFKVPGPQLTAGDYSTAVNYQYGRKSALLAIDTVCMLTHGLQSRRRYNGLQITLLSPST